MQISIREKGGVEMLIQQKRAQSITEYAILLAIVIAAVVGMQNEIRRGLSGRYHDGLNYLVRETSVLGTTQQWEPSTGTKITTSQTSNRTRNEFYEDEEEGVWMRIKEDTGTEFTSTKIE